MASEMEFSQHNKVKRRSPWHGPMVLVLLFFVVILVMSLAFRVSKIEVINASEYTDEEIIRASGVERGANLFFVDRFKAASMIFSDLPYMDTVSITRQLPNKIVIQAEGSAPAAYMVIDEEYWLLDRSGKMLGTTDSLTAGNYPEIRSLEPMTVLEGEDMLVEGTNAERLAVLQTTRRSARRTFPRSWNGSISAIPQTPRCATTAVSRSISARRERCSTASPCSKTLFPSSPRRTPERSIIRTAAPGLSARIEQNGGFLFKFVTKTGRRST